MYKKQTKIFLPKIDQKKICTEIILPLDPSKIKWTISKRTEAFDQFLLLFSQGEKGKIFHFHQKKLCLEEGRVWERGLGHDK